MSDGVLITLIICFTLATISLLGNGRKKGMIKQTQEIGIEITDDELSSC